ncbi:MAG: VCBS repeat-containing protein [Bacteroidetes bacterium]|nr:VCBS repeat-containing protein [Bacteroidota bacterium]
MYATSTLKKEQATHLIDRKFPFAFSTLIFFFIVLPSLTNLCYAQWFNWHDESTSRLIVSSVANSDAEEKDMWVADLNNDGRDDLIVARKQPFSSPSQPGKSTLLLMNVGGIMTDQTLLYAPQLIDSISFARDIFVGDFDGDNWKDVVIANTFLQQPQYFRNKGNDSLGNWLGLVDESLLRFPVLTEDPVRFCALWGGDVTGDGHMDLYFVNYRQNSSGGAAQDYLLINNGTGYFTNQSAARLGTLRNSAFGTAVQLVDIDNDGDRDIIKNSTLYNVAPWNARGVIVLFNNGTGTFTKWINLVPTGSPYMFDIADFNSDGKKDFYVVDDGSDYILRVTTIYPDSSLTVVRTNLNYSSSNGFGGNVHVADLDLDGDMDIGVADVDVDIPPCNSSRRMAIYRNDNGVMVDVYGTTAYAWADNSYDFAWLDINNDGLKDFITGYCAGYGVFMNDSCELAPNNADYDLDGLPDACDACPTNPDPNCAPVSAYPTVSLDDNIARQWNEMLLASIRRDFARPTVHARNLFHHSSAMWDAWAAYDNNSIEFLLGKTVGAFTCPFTGIPASSNIAEDRRKAISYASYRLLRHRFANSPQAALLMTAYDVHMDSLGYDKNFIDTIYASGDARALGNYIAAKYIAFGLQDGSNEQNAYANTSYTPVNPPLIVDLPGNPSMTNLNRWQPLTLDLFIDQSGNPIPGATPAALSPEWGQVIPFALSPADMVINQRNGFNYKVYHDPGPVPQWQADGGGNTSQYQWNYALVSVWSSHLDPADTTTWDISPATQGNRNVLPANVADYPNFYNLLNGGTTNVGHTVNPATGLPYTPNIVKRGDFARILAEFWADGPDSETPPGHWFGIFNYVSDHPAETKQYKGSGTPLNDLEWSVKGYFALGGAMHDVAVSIWGIKGWYDSPRPVSSIRAMADLGQCTNPLDSNYHLGGLPLIPGYIEVVHPGDPLASGTTNVGKIKLKAWRGHEVINNIDTDVAGVDWILAETWHPYQRASFVSPPFSGYLSGHSTYSRAAAELITDFTGDSYFPGGMGVFHCAQDEFLVFENGPSVSVDLQWATYQDAADESSLSRIWGGIHPPMDDIPGRKIAIEVEADVFAKAETYFINTPNDGIFDVPGCMNPLACNYSSLATQNNGTCILPVTYYNDFDGDGFGDSSVDSAACISLSGYVSNSKDCDDSVATINPNATEFCVNSIDDNCNNIVDEGCGNGSFHLKMLIEGLVQNGGFMISTLFDNGMNPDPNSSDSVYVELRTAASPYSLVHSHHVLLYRNGFASIPYYPSVGSYYIVVKHRNGIETWSKNPVAFNGPSVFFDFSKP